MGFVILLCVDVIVFEKTMGYNETNQASAYSIGQEKAKDMKTGFSLNSQTGYFENMGVSVMAFNDIYASGHQSGVSIIMHGNRVATNGDLRLEQTPGQWQPLPRDVERVVDAENGCIRTTLHYPDERWHLKGFNPMIYPDAELTYIVQVQAEGACLRVTLDLDHPLPDFLVGKACFNMELFPGALFGKPWIMDGKQGIYPRQPVGPTLSLPGNLPHAMPADPEMKILADIDHLAGVERGYNPITADNLIAAPYACGKCFISRPDDPYNRLKVEAVQGELKLYDGRMNHNNGWFVLSSEIAAGATEKAVEWIITPHVVEEWLYPPVVQLSQVGYLPRQEKSVVIELDKRDERRPDIVLQKITAEGTFPVRTLQTGEWGNFLRYHYLKADFSDVTEEGLYRVVYGDAQSSVFRIAGDIYARGVWQPVLEYFLPVQMCHMRVSEKYRVWHGLCHDDDARMAPVNCNHFDGYMQGGETLTKYQPGDHVPGVNRGGWHDAGDFDLRVESQAGEAYILSLIYETFGLCWDATTIDQEKKITEIHQPDGKNDLLQQIEHGALTVVGGWKALGRLYRGIICNDLRQYVMLGDAAAMTDHRPGNSDDRWVFTEDNPGRELTTAAQLSAVSRALTGFNDELARDALQAAKELFRITDGERNEWSRAAKVHAAVELFLTTGEKEYKAFLLSQVDFICEKIDRLGWILCRAVKKLQDAAFEKTLRKALEKISENMVQMSEETPYGIPYRPHIWGAGWQIQGMAFQYYFLHDAFPDLFAPALMSRALNFVLGCHPGSNTASFASGVGAVSATMAYGMNRADFSFIPGGVVSGTALIRPDFPELLPWPFLWQQTEYVMGGGSSHYMFLVLAVQKIFGDQ